MQTTVSSDQSLQLININGPNCTCEGIPASCFHMTSQTLHNRVTEEETANKRVTQMRNKRDQDIYRL